MGDVQVFLVRVWQHLSQFRASVRGIGEGEPQLFDEPRQLGEYLREASRTESAAPADQRTGDPADPIATSEGTTQEHRS